MDVKTTFIHVILQEQVYFEQPQGFEVHDKKTLVSRLKKEPYGLKKDSRAWYADIDSYPTKLGVTRHNVDPNLYFKVVQAMPLIFGLYVDDLLLTGSEALMLKCKRDMASKFKMKDIRLMH